MCQKRDYSSLLEELKKDPTNEKLINVLGELKFEIKNNEEILSERSAIFEKNCEYLKSHPELTADWNKEYIDNYMSIETCYPAELGEKIQYLDSKIARLESTVDRETKIEIGIDDIPIKKDGFLKDLEMEKSIDRSYDYYTKPGEMVKRDRLYEPEKVIPKDLKFSPDINNPDISTPNNKGRIPLDERIKIAIARKDNKIIKTERVPTTELERRLKNADEKLKSKSLSNAQNEILKSQQPKTQER